ncbi:hypothetical protein JCM19992_13300 [Thermostilla marina]
MTWLVENPTPILMVGIIFLAACAGLFLTTVRKEFLWACAGILLAMGAVAAIDWWVVTDREQIQTLIAEGEDALEAGDLDRVLSFLSPNAEKTRERARWALATVEFRNVNVSNLEITVNNLTSPPTATLRFHGTFRYKEKVTPDQFEGVYAAKFTVELEKVGDRWLITDHYEYEATPL